MSNKKIPACVGIAVIVIIAITVGVFVWKYKNNKPEAEMLNTTSQKDKSVKENPFDNFKISDFSNWEIYRDGKIGVEIKYPPELYLNTSDEKIVFDYLKPDNPTQKREGSILAHFSILLEQKDVDQYINEHELNTLQNFKQTQIQLNEISAEQITYTDTFAGGIMYTILIQNGSNLIIIKYAGGNKLEDTFSKMLSTINIKKIEEVSFCGKIYKADKSIINSVDIVKKISIISEKETWICKNIELGKFEESGISITQKKVESENNSYLIAFFHNSNENEEKNPFNQSPFIFKFNFQKNIVLYQNQFDGSFKSIGTIK